MSAHLYDEAFEWHGRHWDPDLPLGEWWDLLADAGWSFPSWPQGYGGRGLSAREAKAAEQARLDAGAFGPPKGIATFLTAPTLMTYGTTEQLDRYMPGIIRGRDVWCQLFSEPGAGSDLAGLATRAERDGDEWVVTGQKVWNSGAQHAKYGILMARTDPDQPKHKGISYFLIDMHQDAIDVRPLREMTGEFAFNEVFLSEARVADADRLGEVGEGWRIGMTTLSHERDPDNAGSGSGFMFGAIDLSVSAGDYAQTVEGQIDGFALAMRGGANKVLDEILTDLDVTADPVMRQRLMKLYSLRKVSKWSTMRAVAALKAGGQPGPEVSTLKVIGAEASRQTRDIGLQAMGATGMLWGDDTPTDGLFHAFCMFTPALSVAGGSDEVNRNIIGERVLGLPREPGETEQRQQPWSQLPRS